MQLERVKNASRNMVYGTALQVFKMVVPFAMRTVMIYVLGVEYLGLNSLFASVLSVLNLAEMGVVSAMVYSMYKPIIDDDTEKICAILRLYKIYYRIIGCVVGGMGLALLPYIPQLISGDVPPDIDIYVLYLLNLASTVFSYWFFAYKGSILQAHQRNDVISKATLIADVTRYSLQFVAIGALHSYYLYVIINVLAQVFSNVLAARFAERMYPAYRARGVLPKEERRAINQRIRDLFTAKIGTVVVYSADTIVISAFLGLAVLGIYQNYYYLFTAVASLIAIVFSSVQAGLGNSILVDSREKVFSDFKAFLLIMMWVTGFCSACFMCLYQPFMELWVGPGLLLDFDVVVLLVVYFFVYCLNFFLNTYKDASGMWHQDRFRPLVSAALNLTLNIVLVQVMGLYGIVLSTILSMLIVGPWLVYNLFNLVFGMNYLWAFLKRLGYYVLVATLVVLVCYAVCSCVHLPLVATVVVRLVSCCLCANLLFFLFCFKLPEFKRVVQLANRMTNGTFSRFINL